jgi:hypothetical protein
MLGPQTERKEARREMMAQRAARNGSRKGRAGVIPFSEILYRFRIKCTLYPAGLLADCHFARNAETDVNSSPQTTAVSRDRPILESCLKVGI